MTKEELTDITLKPVDEEVTAFVQDRWDNLSKPIDALGDFEKITCKIHGILGEKTILHYKKCVVIFCADNGVVAQGISQCGQENTHLVATLLGQEKSSANTFARFSGADVLAVDIGINCQEGIPGVRDEKIAYGTADFLLREAMSEEECLKAIEVGIKIARECKAKGYHLIATGEMGIGNTTTATALLCALTLCKPKEVTGRGAGLSDEALMRKVSVIEQALKKYELDRENCDPLYALCSVGGLDIAALVGLFIGGAIEGLPIIIDGLISAVAALCASLLVCGCEKYMIASHSGKEKGVSKVLSLLGLESIINGNMAFGEGMGAIMCFPVLDMVLDFLNNSGTFQDGGIKKYERLL